MTLTSNWFQNRSLFSDHFLQERLPEWKEWKVNEDLGHFRSDLLALYEAKKPILPHLNEAQTEDEFIKPVFDFLGYADSYIVQASTKIGQQTNRPDYALFQDASTKDKAYTKIENNDYTQCIGVADAKYWGRELDLAKSSERDTFTNLNPSFQIAGYLTGTKQNWGILTNGRLWRLYSTKSHLPLGNYYQVNLVQLLEEAPAEALKYFYVFFRKEALLRVDGKSFLDRVLEGSEEYAVELEADIKERAYDVVELLCRGFAVGFTGGKLNDASLKDIYDNSLTLLYRLLFVFYAEARELLPLTSNASYRDNYSLRRLAHDIDEIFKKGYELSSGSTQYYYYLKTLFKLIGEGDPKLDVPEYNGGLFDPHEHPFIETHAIPDSHLVKAIHQLARITDKKLKREVAVDYNTLSERHLGSIYEGLLEFRPQIAPYDLVVIKVKGSTKYAPASKQPGKKTAYHKGDLYLVNDKGERKASGSYYTPEYIVNYIVENTLDQLVKEAHEKVETLKPTVDKEIAKWRKLREQKKGLEPTEKYDRAISEEYKKLLTPFLSLKVLDPAMGSGHFLARATDFLAEAIATDPCIELPLELTEASELTYYRRRVVESCIYGVDLNPLAVELAKLTLWLTTMAKSKPLSFLNHHLRAGNSLIGARIADLDEIPKAKGKKKGIDLSRAPVQLGLFQQALNQKLYDLLQNRALIAQLPTETLEDVHNKQEWEKDFEHNMERFRTLADVWVSTFFGNDVRWDEYNTLIEGLQSPASDWGKLLGKKYVQKALTASKERQFFHWELEFPEVFYDEQGNRKVDAGFDAVIGNPPYDLLKRNPQMPALNEFIDYVRKKSEYKLAISSMLNVFLLMVLKSHTLAARGKMVGLIIPMSFLSDPSSSGVRQSLIENHLIVSVHAFPQKDDENNRVFKEAKLSTTIIITQICSRTTTFILFVHPGKYIELDSPKLSIEVENLRQFDPEYLTIPLGNPDETKLLHRIYSDNNIDSFRRVIDVQVGEIDMTLDRDCAQLEESKYELLKGAHIQRYLHREKPKQGTREWINIVAFRKKYGMRSAKSNLFNYPRVIFQGITGINDSLRLKATAVPSGYFLANSINYVVMKNNELSMYYILALLNSRLLEWRFRLTSSNNNVNNYEILALPYRNIFFSTPSVHREEINNKFVRVFNTNPDDLIVLVQEWLNSRPEKADVVHDLLAFLAEEMIWLNKEKQSKIRAFLSWLEKEIIKGSIEDQKNKTRIKGFHEGTLEELMDVLKKNKVVPDPCPSSTWDTISSEFSAAMNTLGPLKGRIMITDRLIDQIVYKLYGLTNDEIAIVERQSSHNTVA